MGGREREGSKVLIGGDFNTRIGRKGRKVKEEEEMEKRKEKSKDMRVNGEGKNLCKFLKKNG